MIVGRVSRGLYKRNLCSLQIVFAIIPFPGSLHDPIQFATIEPDQVASGAGVNHNAPRPDIRVRLHRFQTNRAERLLFQFGWVKQLNRAIQFFPGAAAAIDNWPQCIPLNQHAMTLLTASDFKAGHHGEAERKIAVDAMDGRFNTGEFRRPGSWRSFFLIWQVHDGSKQSGTGGVSTGGVFGKSRSLIAPRTLRYGR